MKEKTTSETLMISYREYRELVDASNWLECLNLAGVDNWDGISHAHEIYKEEFEELNFEDE